MLFLPECIRIFTTCQAIPFKRNFYYWILVYSYANKCLLYAIRVYTNSVCIQQTGLDKEPLPRAHMFLNRYNHVCLIDIIFDDESQINIHVLLLRKWNRSNTHKSGLSHLSFHLTVLVLFFCSWDKVYHKQEVRFLLYFYVSLSPDKHNPYPLEIFKIDSWELYIRGKYNSKDMVYHVLILIFKIIVWFF